MAVLALGLNHQTAPLDLRGRLAFAPGQLSTVLQDFRQRLQRAAPEAAILSTCNRTELYVAADAAAVHEIAAPALSWLASQGGIPDGSCASTPTCAKSAMRPATPSGWRQAWTRWSWASRKSWAR